MEELAEILKDLEQGKISADNAEEQVLRLFNVSSAERKFCPFCKNEVSRILVHCSYCDAHLMPD